MPPSERKRISSPAPFVRPVRVDRTSVGQDAERCFFATARREPGDFAKVMNRRQRLDGEALRANMPNHRSHESAGDFVLSVVPSTSDCSDRHSSGDVAYEKLYRRPRAETRSSIGVRLDGAYGELPPARAPVPCRSLPRGGQRPCVAAARHSSGSGGSHCGTPPAGLVTYAGRHVSHRDGGVGGMVLLSPPAMNDGCRMPVRPCARLR